VSLVTASMPEPSFSSSQLLRSASPFFLSRPQKYFHNQSYGLKVAHSVRGSLFLVCFWSIPVIWEICQAYRE